MPRVPVHYDFASTLCYVAHRVLPGLAADLERLGIELEWTPLDLARVTGWRRGVEVPEVRRRNAERVARDLEVAVAVPRVWEDSRPAGAAALAIAAEAGAAAGAAWRERIFTAVFEERRAIGDPADVGSLARELGLALPPLDPWLEELERRSREAIDDQVTGVPTFMLDGWAFGGIQSRDTMRAVLERWVERRERRGDA